MAKRPPSSLQDLAIDTILTQVLEQDPAHVFRLLRRVRQKGSALRDDDVVELVEGDVAYRVMARHLPTHARTLLEDVLERRPMYGTRILLGDTTAVPEMDDDRYSKWTDQLGAAVSEGFGIPIPICYTLF